MSSSVSLVRVVAESARQAGLPVEALLADAKIDPRVLTDPEGRIATSAFLSFFDGASRAAKRPGFGTSCAKHLDAEAFGLLGFVLGSAPTLGDAFERLGRFSRLLSDELSIEVQVSSRRAIVRYAMAARPHVAALFEMSFVHLVRTARRGTEDRFRASEIVFSHPVDLATLAKALPGVEIIRGRHDEVRCDPSMLALPLLGANRTLLGILERQANGMLEKLPLADDFLASVRGAVLRELALGEPTLAMVAERLGIGARTLQRRLSAHEVNYQALLDHVRRDEALIRLQAPEVSIAEVARGLGYRDASAFHHAFRRWTGESPGRTKARRAGGA